MAKLHTDVDECSFVPNTDFCLGIESESCCVNNSCLCTYLLSVCALVWAIPDNKDTPLLRNNFAFSQKTAN